MIKRFTALAGRGKARVIGRVCLASAAHLARAIWMETMYLVAGLAVAGLVGIAAAFYFSIRSGNGGKRLRPAGASSRGRSSRHHQPEDDTGPSPSLDFGDPVLVGGRRGGHGVPGSRTGGDSRQAGARAVEPASSRQLGEPASSRRRMGFRKGADVDEELWPVEEFGVNDEQFWDDLAADKPLATTARTAQQDPGTRKRRGAGSGAYAESRSGPNPATERTMIPPAYGATQPVPGATQLPGATQVSGATQPFKTAAGGSQPTSTAALPASAASRSAGVPAQPAETRGRRRANSAEEDPLTSAAFSLRPSGPVDGRSSLRTVGSRTGGSGPESASTYGDTSSGSQYPFAGAPYGDPSSAAEEMNAPPYEESYGYGNRGSAPAGENPRRPNGTRSHARPTGAGQGGQATRPTRQVYPQDGYPAGNRHGAGGYQGTGSYLAPAYPGNGYSGNGYPRNGYPGNGYLGSGGYPGNGQHAPYDPREDYRRLTHRR